jgi:general stress protein 26
MTKEAEIEKKFWKSLSGDRTAMLGLTGVEDGHAQPMTAQTLHDDDERGPIWFFTSSETNLFRHLGTSHAASLHFSSKGHDLFASLEGDLVVDNNRARIEELWSPFVEAWFEGGKDDPKLRLIRFDPYHAQVWLNENSLFAGIRLLLGRDPKEDYKDKVADVNLGQH